MFLSSKKGVKKLFDVLGIGCNSIDLLCLLDGSPVEDEKIEVPSIEMQGGGNVGTALVAVSRLGGKAGYYWAVGDDEYKDRVLSEFNEYGVDTRFVTVKKGKNPIAVILINRQASTRTIFYTKNDITVLSPEELEESVLKAGKILLIDFFHPKTSLAVSRIAKREGISVVVDAEKVVGCSEEIMDNSDYVISSKSFAQEFCGSDEGVEDRKLLDMFVQKIRAPFVCITLGKKGVLAFEREKKNVFTQRAFPVEVVDTTGAGDVFHGAFAFFIAKGYSVRESVRYSSACAALKCRELGGRKGIPRMDEVMDLVRKFDV